MQLIFIFPHEGLVCFRVKGATVRPDILGHSYRKSGNRAKSAYKSKYGIRHM